MDFIRINGKEIASTLHEEQRIHVDKLSQIGIIPRLVVILLGNNPASQSYIKGKLRVAEKVGIVSEWLHLSDQLSEQALLDKITELNNDTTVHGILVQLPLPNHICEQKVFQAISPYKDVDGFHPENVGRLTLGHKCFLPCTPAGIMKMIAHLGLDLTGKHAVVVGRSNIVGKPISLLLQQADATVTMCHSRTNNLVQYTKQADLLIAAVGKPLFITTEHVKPNAVVFDVGINRVDNELVGDVDYDQVAPLTAAITPVPGGVGPMTIAMLMHNTILASQREV